MLLYCKCARNSARKQGYLVIEEYALVVLRSNWKLPCKVPVSSRIDFVAQNHDFIPLSSNSQQFLVDFFDNQRQRFFEPTSNEDATANTNPQPTSTLHHPVRPEVTMHEQVEAIHACGICGHVDGTDVGAGHDFFFGKGGHFALGIIE